MNNSTARTHCFSCAHWLHIFLLICSCTLLLSGTTMYSAKFLSGTTIYLMHEQFTVFMCMHQILSGTMHSIDLSVLCIAH